MGARNPWIETPEQRNVIEAETLKPWRKSGLEHARRGRPEGKMGRQPFRYLFPSAKAGGAARSAPNRREGLVRRRRCVVGGGD